MTTAALRELGALEPPDASALRAPAPEVAVSLLGHLLVRREDDGGRTVVRIVETEAYRQDDPASHAHRGPRPSTAAMFGPPGRAYVYFTYGMHHCVNVSCEEVDVGAAVLLRAAVPLEGEERIRGRRGGEHAHRDLLRGPARLTQGLAVDRGLDGSDLLDGEAPLHLADDGWRPPPGSVRTGPRVGVRLAADVDWRFWIEGVPEVSRYVRHPRAEAE